VFALLVARRRRRTPLRHQNAWAMLRELARDRRADDAGPDHGDVEHLRCATAWTHRPSCERRHRVRGAPQAPRASASSGAMRGSYTALGDQPPPLSSSECASRARRRANAATPSAVACRRRVDLDRDLQQVRLHLHQRRRAHEGRRRPRRRTSPPPEILRDRARDHATCAAMPSRAARANSARPLARRVPRSAPRHPVEPNGAPSPASAGTKIATTGHQPRSRRARRAWPSSRSRRACAAIRRRRPGVDLPVEQ